MPNEKKPGPTTPTAAPPISTQLATTSVAHFMKRNVITVTPSTSVRLAMQMMLTHNISGLVVADTNKKCVGIYSEFDAMLQGSSQTIDAPIHFTHTVHQILDTGTFKDALLLLLKHRIKRLPVVDRHGRIVGIISRQDFMKAIFEDQPHEKA